jgi:ABC-type lipopolysaccharide export system ATPase subunit
MGRNGAGKSTALKAIMGLVPPCAGTVTLDGHRLDGLPAHEIPRRGIGYVPQGRRLFAELTVAENLEIGLIARLHGPPTRARVLDLFPRLAERLEQTAGTLSGGEQQMLAIGRALCLEPPSGFVSLSCCCRRPFVTATRGLGARCSRTNCFTSAIATGRGCSPRRWCAPRSGSIRASGG